MYTSNWLLRGIAVCRSGNAMVLINVVAFLSKVILTIESLLPLLSYIFSEVHVTA